MREHKAAFIALIILAFLGLAFGRTFLSDIQPVLAQGAQPTPTASGPVTATPPPTSPHTDTGECLNCHSDPSMSARFPNGETMSLYFDPEAHPKSSHMPRCKACHEPQKTYPHEKSPQSSCSVCHWQVMG